jgi:hypothetical protein
MSAWCGDPIRAHLRPAAYASANVRAWRHCSARFRLQTTPRFGIVVALL